MTYSALRLNINHQLLLHEVRQELWTSLKTRNMSLSTAWCTMNYGHTEPRCSYITSVIDRIAIVTVYADKTNSIASPTH